MNIGPVRCFIDIANSTCSVFCYWRRDVTNIG